MKKLIGHDLGFAAFSAAGKTITFFEVELSQDQILLITNTTRGTILYNFADSSRGGVLTGTVLALACDTSGMVDSDAIQIYVDVPDAVTQDSQNLLKLAEELDASDFVADPNGELVMGLFPLILDQTSGVKASVATPDLLKDLRGSLVPSDAPLQVIGSAQAVNQVLLMLDTTGYQSIGLQIFGTWAGTLTFQASNDQINWVPVAGWGTGTSSAAATTTTANGLFSIPCVGKWFRVVSTTFTSGMPQAVAFLRNQPASPMVAPAATIAVNASQVAGTGIPSAGVAGVMPMAGNTPVGNVPASYPAGIGGVDPNGRMRRINTDLLGNLIAMDPTRTDGLSALEILQLVLLENRITNQYLYELPTLLNRGIGQVSDEPNALRNDPTLFP
jgi:hypothetical protein